MTKLIIIYDDCAKATGRTKDILGNKSFGDMILKRQSMFTRIKKIVNTIPDVDIIRIKNLDSFNPNTLPSNAIFLHILSSSAIISPENFAIIVEKATFAKNNFSIKDTTKTHGGIFKNRTSYLAFLEEYKNLKNINFLSGDSVIANCFADLTNYNTLLMYISSGFDARYFNSLQGDSYTVTKRSTDKKKIKMEYSYYWLLPESMKTWMVMPYDYQETAKWASYTMERMPMTDIAIRWTHGAIDTEELKEILDKTFYFFNHRTQRKITKKAYRENTTKLYITKVKERIALLKKTPKYHILAQLISTGTDYSDIDSIIEYYYNLYQKITSSISTPAISVIGHGDVFFANMLYSKELGLLRLIDPKGALTEKDLWMDPYYDIAKLSHSICGNYDFFNTSSYTISINQSMQYELNIHTDNTKAKEIFRSYLSNNNYSYTLVRLYEASLFLSMLPYHIDNPHKVFGFILNAINILKELDNV